MKVRRLCPALFLACLALAGCCRYPGPGIDRQAFRFIMQNGREVTPGHLRAEVRRCERFYRGKLALGEFIRDGNPEYLRVESGDGNTIYTYLLYTIKDRQGKRINGLDQTTFALDTGPDGIVRECRSWGGPVQAATARP